MICMSGVLCQISFLSYVFVDQIKFEKEREGCVVCVVSYVIAFVGEVPFPQTRGTRRVSKGVKGEGFRYVCKCVSVKVGRRQRIVSGYGPPGSD
jgi:hypothetical protein